MSCGQIALKNLGIIPNHYFASEIDPYCLKVTQRNFPNTKQLGDILKIKGEDLPPIDLMIGGSPCQGFSFAGRQLAFEDPRSRLFFEFVRLLEEVKPKYFLLENVKMQKFSEEVISHHLGVEPIVINSSLVSAQNRTRLYWTNIPNIEQPEDRGIFFGNIREFGVNNLKYYYGEKALNWLRKVSRKKGKILFVPDVDDKFPCLEATMYKKYSNQRFFGISDDPTDPLMLNRMRYANQKNEHTVFLDCETNTVQTTDDWGLNEMPFTTYNKFLSGDFFFRFVTPLECERLQTVPDDYTDGVSDTQRYKMLGNGWTVDVISHILSHTNTV